MFNVNVPSENTLVSQKNQIDGEMNLYFEVTEAFTATDTCNIVASAFPLNSCLNSASMTINNFSVSVSSQDVQERIEKLLHPDYLAAEQSMTAYLPDAYFAETQEMVNQQGTQSTVVLMLVLNKQINMEWCLDPLLDSNYTRL